jgi:hypothetical protein
MTAHSHVRGHPVDYIEEWCWADTKEPIDDIRPCAKCGRPPTPEGYDACIGYIPGATAACCGHGLRPKSVNYVEWWTLNAPSPNNGEKS